MNGAASPAPSSRSTATRHAAADPPPSLLATLIAHGTNLGLAAMSQSVDTLTAEALQDTSRWFLRVGNRISGISA